MKKTTPIKLIGFLLILSIYASAQTYGYCCTWNSVLGGCYGDCESGVCTFTPVGYTKNCTCIPSNACRWNGETCEGTCGIGYDCIQQYDILGQSYCTCLQCVPEGQSHAVTPGAARCCSGLAEINCSTPDNEGNCQQCEGSVICAQCGNGICGPGENKCNCPEDCYIEPTCDWINGNCVGECGNGECILIGYDFNQSKGICSCRDPNGCRLSERTILEPNDGAFDSVDTPTVVLNSCTGYCSNGVCGDIDESPTRIECACRVISVPEFTTFLTGLTIVTISSGFAYLLIRRRK